MAAEGVCLSGVICLTHLWLCTLEFVVPAWVPSQAEHGNDMVYEYVSLHVHAHAHTRDRTFLLHKEFARQIKSPPGVLVKREVMGDSTIVNLLYIVRNDRDNNPLPLPRQFVRVLESPKVGLRLCKCAPTVLSPKTLKRQPHEQAPSTSLPVQ